MTVLINEDWEAGWGSWEHPYGEADIVEDATAPSGTHSLRYTLSSGNLGGNSPDIVAKSFARNNELWGSVRLKVSSNYDWPPIEDKFIFIWTDTNNACITLYSGNMLSFLSQPTGEWLPSQRWNAPSNSLVKGQWATIEFQAVINTAGVANGTMKVWLNDVLVISTNAVPWRSSGGLAFGSMALENVFGGPPGTRQNGPYYNWFDKIIIGTTQADIGESGEDSIPNQFTFTDVTGASISTQYTSNSITVLGIDSTNTTISISGNSGTYSVNGGAYTSSSGYVYLNDVITVRQTSSASYSTAVNTTLNIGGVTDTYTVTTGAQPITTAPPSILIEIHRP